MFIYNIAHALTLNVSVYFIKLNILYITTTRKALNEYKYKWKNYIDIYLVWLKNILKKIDLNVSANRLLRIIFKEIT